MNKKSVFYPIISIFLLILIFPMSNSHGFPFYEELFVLIFLGTIISSFIGILQNINILRKKNTTWISILMLIISVLIFLFVTIWSIIILDCSAYNLI